MLLERIEVLKDDPVGEDWDGVLPPKQNRVI